MAKKTNEGEQTTETGASSAATTQTANTSVANNDRFKKEVDETPNQSFVKFEGIGESKTGFLMGTKNITRDGKSKKHFIMRIGGVDYILPSNYQLNSKLDNLVKIKGGSIPAKGIEVFIEFTGHEEIEGQANKMKTFKVLTT